MSALRNSICFALLALLAIACAREQGYTDSEHGTAKAASSCVGVSLGETSRTTLQAPMDGIYPAVWSEGDRISVNGIVSRALTGSEAGGKEVVFQFDEDLLLPFNVLYPASESGEYVHFSSVQQYRNGSFADGAAPMWGSTDEFADVALHHLSAVLKFALKGDAEGKRVTRIVVSALGGEALCGDFQMKFSESGMFTGEVSAPEGGSSSIELNCGEGAVLPMSDALSFFVCIPAGSYSKGFKAVVMNNEGKAMTLYFMTDKGGTEVAPGKVIEFPETVFSATESVLTISSFEDLQVFAASALSYEKAVLLNDIEVPSAAWTPVNGFTGEFDGGMHVISGLDAPLFGEAAGCVIRNLVLDSDITALSSGFVASFARSLSGSGRMVNCHGRGKIVIPSSTITRAGGLVASISGAGTRIVDCTCSADIQLVSNSTSSVWCGGIVGLVESGDVENCRFEGSISMDGKAGNLFYGGVAGRDNGSSGIISSSCTGSVSSLSSMEVTGMCYMGGVSGFIAQTVKDCTHGGTLSCEGVSVKNLSLGGVSGTCRGGASGCVNDGSVALSVMGLPTFAYVGGVFGTLDASAALSVSNLSSTGKAVVNIDASPVSAQNLSAGGIIGSCSMAQLTISSCTNKGSILASGASSGYTVGLLLGGIMGSVVRTSASVLTIDKCTNTGSIHLEEEKSSSNYVYAGGILGLAASGNAASKSLTLSIIECKNEGDITRIVNNMSYASDKRTFCGGICGAVGGDNRVHNTYDNVNATISNCSNSGLLRFNRFTTPSSFKEISSVESYTGGIAGVTNSAGNFRTVISCCVNSGNILSTSGYNGGIVGFVYTGTRICGEKIDGGVNYTRNTGNIGIFDTSDAKEKGSGYMNGGGIAGCLNSVNSNNSIEYCFNEGYVAASTSGATGAGGIVGDLRLDAAVNHCKNSGTVRFKGNKYTGQISGTSSSYRVLNCAVGGRCARSNASSVGLDNIGGDERYLFSKYIYALTESITTQDQIDVFAPGCVWWNGIDKLDWEL